MSNTLQTFWHDANTDCELDSKRLIELYAQLLERSSAAEDQCTALFKHRMRKKLIQLMADQLEESFAVHSLKSNRELRENLKKLLKIDKKLMQIIWERVINEVYLFVKPEEIIHAVTGQLTEEQEIQIIALKNLLNKYLYLNAEYSETVLPLLTHHISGWVKDKSTSGSISVVKSLQKLYERLPKALRFLYESNAKENIGLLNYQHFEYLYAPRDNGPDAERRLPLTWSETKNSTDSDGHLMVSFNEDGLVAFGSRFAASLKYLYADVEEMAPYFWIGSGIKSSQWWQVILPQESIAVKPPEYLIFQNEESKYVLCATREYDENRRYVTLLNANENLDNPACFWLVTRF